MEASLGTEFALIWVRDMGPRESYYRKVRFAFFSNFMPLGPILL